ncbi:MAG: ACP S-malonyltransferase, partial [Miltoncostaeaceae bacterium]
MIAVMFPGQGAQSVGMGLELAESYAVARETFEEADDTLGYPLSDVCFDGPADRLTQTDVCQPALVATSIAAFRVAAAEGLVADVVLGHSLGEYSALVACGSLPFATAIALVAERGAAMQDAGTATPGAMVALIGLDDDDAEAMCAEVGDVWPANFNCPGQVVASGHEEAVDRLIRLAGERGVKCARLAVSGAFHSPLMTPAAERLAPALDAWEPAEPDPGFLSTTTASPEGADRLRPVLLDQLTSPVRFGAAVAAALDDGADCFVEVGPGKVLS